MFSNAFGSEESFERLLSESQLRFQMPNEFVNSDQKGSVACDKLLRHQQKKAALCLMIRPLSRMEIDYNDPHSSAPNPNQVYPLLFESLKNALSNHDNSYSTEYSEPQAKELFGADWAAAAVFTLKSGASREHKEAFLLALHKHHHADAYFLFTYNEPDEAKRIINQSLSTLVFHRD